MIRPGYAVAYDFVEPLSLWPNLETKVFSSSLFHSFSFFPHVPFFRQFLVYFLLDKLMAQLDTKKLRLRFSISKFFNFLLVSFHFLIFYNQGLLAGVNASLFSSALRGGTNPSISPSSPSSSHNNWFCLDRADGYMGVLVDDLTTRYKTQRIFFFSFFIHLTFLLSCLGALMNHTECLLPVQNFD